MLDGIRSPLDGLRSPFGKASGGAAAPLTATLHAVLTYNQTVFDAIAASPVDTANGKSAVGYGNSLAAAGHGGAPSWVAVMAALVNDAVANEGASGERTDEIIARLDGSGDEAKIVFFEGGTNDSSQNTTTHEFAGIVTEFANVAALLVTNGSGNTDFIFTSGTFDSAASVGSHNGVDRIVVDNKLRTAYGGKFFKFMLPLLAGIDFDDMTATEKTQVYRGQIPASLRYDTTHTNTAGNEFLANDLGRLMLGIAGNACYPHHDIHYWDITTASSAKIADIRHIGPDTSWSIVGGNEDGFFDINSSGELLRSASGSPAHGVYPVRVRANGSQDAFQLLMTGGDGNFGGALIGQYGAFAFPNPPAFTDLTIIWFGRCPPGVTDACVIVGGQTGGVSPTGRTAVTEFSGSSVGRFSVTIKDSSNTTIASNGFTGRPAGFDAEQDYCWMLSYDQSAGTAKFTIGQLTTPGAVPVWSDTNLTTGTLTGDASMGDMLRWMTSIGESFASAGARIVKRMAIYDGAWDVHDNAVRSKFVDQGTDILTPKALTNGVVDSITPFCGCDVDGPGDLMPERWYGSFTTDEMSWCEPWVNGTAQYDAP